MAKRTRESVFDPKELVKDPQTIVRDSIELVRDSKEIVRDSKERIKQRIDPRIRKTVDKSMLVLIILGLAANIVFSKLAIAVGVPLFLDSIGTIGAAVLGGALPGIIVGFLSNLINGISDPITMYYGILSVLMAAAAAYMSKRRMFATFGKTLIAMLVFSAIGGALGSLLTWLLYGFNLGAGISAPLVQFFKTGLSFTEFISQFFADVLIDLGDKLVTVVIIFFVLRLLPDRWLEKTYYGRLYTKNGKAEAELSDVNSRQYRKRSLKAKVLLLIISTSVVIGVSAIAISYVIYSTEMMERFVATSRTGAALASDIIDGGDIGVYLEKNGTTAKYKLVNVSLSGIYESIPEIERLSVYQVRGDGFHVVFDVDTPERAGKNCGDVISFDESVKPFMSQFLNGQPVEPVVKSTADDYYLTVYDPIAVSPGEYNAYVCVDVSMESIKTGRIIFIIKLLSLLFGASILAVVFAVWYAERRMVEPINAMTVSAGEFAYDNDQGRLDSVIDFESLNIDTGDEIETLYKAIAKTVSDVAGYIGQVQEKAETITRLQNSMIVSFADMVENRDENTGEHIKHTATYVSVIARELQREGKFPDQLTDEGVKSMVRSAPLHDIGKIKISDVILNKPGKLTDEEFEVMKTHASAGRDILKSISDSIGEGGSYLSTAVEMASFHHEWWNGKGYPYGLAGDAIPLSARIMAVADVYDALISKRSYKNPFPPEKAREIILEESGSHFDPQVVAAFVSCWEELEALNDDKSAQPPCPGP